MMSQRVIFFTGLLLPPSETFIRAQGEAMQQFTAFYVGSRRVPGLALPRDRTYAVNSGNYWGVVAEAAFKLTGYAPALYRKIQQLKPALIHAHFGVNGALALPIAKKLNLPLVTTFYGLDATLDQAKATQNSLTTRAYFRRQVALKRETRLFIAVSDFIRQKLLTQGFPPERVITHYYGVDTQLFQPGPNAVREPVVLFVGRLVEKKGCEYLIQAMAQIQVSQPEVKLVIVGDGRLRAELEAIAAQQLRNYSFLGIQPPEVCRQWMQRSQVIVVPSVTAANGDAEGLPTVVLEAQAIGLPVVATVHAGIPEAVIHAETGMLAPERDWQQLANCILHVLNNSDLWQRLSQQAQKRVRQHFDLCKQTQRLEKLYEQVLVE
ncbi:MAG TPA: glycosyltransferase [Leptolyngbyaceae cyanobacterium M33_DOE_097]|uniref:Glycosyltransferase n=1 Tax=Oscillatoriales cyanobacterium SpSt-418 TaxID=2282169 RepID=A0A7C3PL58_9CYAN|nr:glycosyltransferase [Leptolyngbyaceae cyanobacterium M33_DOE_097]